jgi:hypothetical protein
MAQELQMMAYGVNPPQMSDFDSQAGD